MNTSDRIQKILSDISGFEVTEINSSSSLRDDLQLDSLDDVELCMDLEETFRLSIDDSVSAKWQTVSDVERHVTRALADRQAKGAGA